MRRASALLALAAASLAHGAGPALVRTHLAAPGPVWVGQRATIVLELLVTGTFAGTAVLDVPRLPGAVQPDVLDALEEPVDFLAAAGQAGQVLAPQHHVAHGDGELGFAARRRRSHTMLHRTSSPGLGEMPRPGCGITCLPL